MGGKSKRIAENGEDFIRERFFELSERFPECGGVLVDWRGGVVGRRVVVFGRVVFLLATPGVSSRYCSKVDELWSFDALHFGIVTAGLLGGFVGGRLNTSCWSLGFFRRA